MFSDKYSYFLQIVEQKNLSRAAENLYISQPALTKYLHKLEEELGVQLFERRQSNLKITDAGQCFYEYVTRSINSENELRARLAEVQNAGRASITIGMPLWRSSVILPDFLPSFLSRHPLISVQLFEGSASVLENALMNDTVDFCVMNLPVNYAKVVHVPLAEEYIFLVGSKKDPFVKEILLEHPDNPHPTVKIQQVAGHPFILNKSGQHITDYVDEMLSRYNIELPCLLRTANVTTSVNMAVRGLGFAFVPQTGTSSPLFPSGAALFKVNDPPMMATLAAVYKSSNYLSAAAQLFITELKEYFVSSNRASAGSGTSHPS